MAPGQPKGVFVAYITKFHMYPDLIWILRQQLLLLYTEKICDQVIKLGIR